MKTNGWARNARSLDKHDRMGRYWPTLLIVALLALFCGKDSHNSPGKLDKMSPTEGGYLLFTDHNLYEAPDKASRLLVVCPALAVGPSLGNVIAHGDQWEHIVCQNQTGYIVYADDHATYGPLDRIQSNKDKLAVLHDLFILSRGGWVAPIGVLVISEPTKRDGFGNAVIILPDTSRRVMTQARRIDKNTFELGSNDLTVSISIVGGNLTARFQKGNRSLWTIGDVTTWTRRAIDQ